MCSSISSILVSSPVTIAEPLAAMTLKRSRSGDHTYTDCTKTETISCFFPRLSITTLEQTILSMLSFKELKISARVCKAGQRYAKNQTLQKLIMLNQIPLASKTLSRMSTEVNWTCVYRNHTNLPQYVKHIWYHQIALGTITSVQAIDNRYLIGTSRRIYVQLDERDERQDKIIMILEHTAQMNAFVVKDNWIISGNGSEARVWDLNTGTCIRTVKSLHTKEIKSLAISGNTIVSGSLDGTICTWNLDSTEPTKLIGKQVGSVYALKIRELANKQEVFCGSDIGELNAFTLEGLTTFSYKYSHSISAIDIHNNQLAVGTFHKVGNIASSAHIWDLTSRKETTSFMTSGGVTRTLCLADHNRLATVSPTSFRLWDINKKNRTSNDAIKELPLSNKQTVSYAISLTKLGFLVGDISGCVKEFCYSL